MESGYESVSYTHLDVYKRQTLGHADGVIFLIVFAGYIFTMVRSAMKARAAGQKVEIEGVEECDNMKELSYGKSILFLIVGAAAIAFGGDLTVDTASRIAIAVSYTHLDVYKRQMVALRDEDGALIGYYEKHEYRARDEEPYYNF